MAKFDEVGNANSPINRVLRKEGGYVNNPYDSGGETNYGITERVARKHGYEGSMKDIPLYLVKKIYKKDYWDAIRLDEVKNECVAWQLFDFAVHSGVSRAVEKLQRILNIYPSEPSFCLTVDGIIGPKTISAINVVTENRLGKDFLVKGIVCLRGAHLIESTERYPKNKRFIKGWFIQRINFK